jgi:drug/metabolite transporter (DMT)-like permease
MTRWRDAGLFVGLAVLWGLSFPAISVGLRRLPPLLFAAARYDVAAVLLLSLAATRAADWLPRTRGDLEAVVGGGLFLVAGNGLLFLAQQTVPSGVAAIMQALVPIVTALWALVLLGERLSPPGVVGVVVGFAGITLVVRPNPANLLAGDTLARLLVVGQVTSVSLGGVLVQRADSTVPRVPLTGWAMLAGAVVLHGVSLALREVPTPGATSPTALGAILYLGVASTAVAFVVYFTILERHGAFQSALVTYLVPVVATLVGVLVLGETIGALTFVGFGLVATGFVLLKRDAIAELVGDALAVAGH